MKKKNIPGYLLPAVPTTEDRICVCMPLPKDWDHIHAFMGQLMNLGYWWTWERDATKKGTEVARVWREIFDCVNSEVNAAMTTGCGCGCGGSAEPVLHRMTDDGALEISTDGGETWIPDPNDPRLTGTDLPNTVPGDTPTDKKCNAATNLVDNVKDAQAQFAAKLEAGSNIFTLALELAGIAIALLFAPEAAPVLVPIFIALATSIVGLLQTVYNAEFTSDVWSQLLCDVFCTVGDNGEFTTSQYNDLLALIDTDFSGNVALTFNAIITGWGLIGTNNACTVGTNATADCSDCGCDEGCALKYTAGLIDGDTLRGTIISNDGTDIFMTADYVGLSSGYAIIHAADLGDCCFVSGVESTDGTVTAMFFIPCGTPYSEGAWTIGGTDHCVQLLQVQAAPPGCTVHITLTECP